MASQPCHQLDKETEGQSPEHLLNTRKTVPTIHVHPIIYRELFNRNMQQFAWESYKSSIDWQESRDRREFVLPGRWVSRSGPRVLHETIMAIALRHNNSGLWDNAASIAAHSNTASRAMAFTFKCLKHYHGNKTKSYGYHIRRTKWYGYTDHVGCLSVKFEPCTG